MMKEGETMNSTSDVQRQVVGSEGVIEMEG
jgi:hypothetical protein